MSNKPVYEEESFIRQAELLASSYKRSTGRSLIEGCRTSAELARQMFSSSLAIASSGMDDERCFNFGSQRAMDAFELDWSTLIVTPNKQHHDVITEEERKTFLSAVNKHGFIDNPPGIRLSSSGRRFRLIESTVWEVFDEKGFFKGAAIVFESWEYL